MPTDDMKSTGRGARVLRRAFLVSSGTLFALTLLAEIGLRIAGDRERSFADSVNVLNRRWVELLRADIFEEVPDCVRRYAMRPGATAEVDGWTFRVNSNRARGPELASPKPENERRMLCLGDSFAFGLWCDEDRTLVGQLCRRANEALAAAGDETTHWTPVNIGVPGYHSGQQLRAFVQDGLATEPDLVVVYYNTNDITNEGFFLDPELPGLRSDHLPLPCGLRRALWSSHLYGYLTRRYTRSFKGPNPDMDPRAPWSHVRPENQRATRDAITEIVRICRERELPIFFVHQPLMTWQGEARDPSWNILELVTWAEDLRAELELPGISMLGWMRGYPDGIDRIGEAPPPNDPVLPDRFFAEEVVQAYWKAADAGSPPSELPALPAEPDFHLTGAGYSSMADVVYPAMRAEGFVP